jgi:putative flippase GtrA
MKVMIKELLIQKTDNTGIHLFRSMGSSGLAFLFDFLILILLVEIFHIYYITAAIAGFITGTTFLYFISVLWIFDSRRLKNRLLEYFLFMFVGLIGGFLNIVFFWIITEKIGFYYMFSRIFAATIIFIFNFTSRKIILFSKIRN